MKKIFSILTCASLLTTAAPFVGAEEIKVEKGDTLWSISQEKNVSIDDIKKWNDLDSDIIKVNETLTIKEEKKYKVKTGDNLWKISQKYDTTVDQLKSWNKLKSDTIHKGDVLIVSKNNGSTTSSKRQTTTVNKAVKAEKTVKAENTVKTEKPKTTASKEITVTATAYTADCEGCSGITATGINLKDNPNKKVISVDPNVIPLGSKVYVDGYGTAIAGDTGGAIKGKKIDVHVPTNSEALNWGRKEVSVKILD